MKRYGGLRGEGDSLIIGIGDFLLLFLLSERGVVHSSSTRVVGGVSCSCEESLNNGNVDTGKSSL